MKEVDTSKFNPKIIEQLNKMEKEIRKLELENFYWEWRMEKEDNVEEKNTWNARSEEIRKEFSTYANINRIISYREMLELEKDYELC